MVQPDLMEAFAQYSILSNDCGLNQADIKSSQHTGLWDPGGFAFDVYSLVQSRLA